MTQHPLIHRSRRALACAALVAAMFAGMMQGGTAHAATVPAEHSAR